MFTVAPRSSPPPPARLRLRRRRQFAGLFRTLLLRPFTSAWVLGQRIQFAALISSPLFLDAPHRKRVGYASAARRRCSSSVVLLARLPRRRVAAAVMSGVFLVLLSRCPAGVEGAFFTHFYNIYLLHGRADPLLSRSRSILFGNSCPLRPIRIGCYHARGASAGRGLVYLGRRTQGVFALALPRQPVSVPAVVYAAGTAPVSYRIASSFHAVR
jgi:hypothetical protein